LCPFLRQMCFPPFPFSFHNQTTLDVYPFFHERKCEGLVLFSFFSPPPPDTLRFPISVWCYLSFLFPPPLVSRDFFFPSKTLEIDSTSMVRCQSPFFSFTSVFLPACHLPSFSPLLCRRGSFFSFLLVGLESPLKERLGFFLSISPGSDLCGIDFSYFPTTPLRASAVNLFFFPEDNCGVVLEYKSTFSFLHTRGTHGPLFGIFFLVTDRDILLSRKRLSFSSAQEPFKPLLETFSPLCFQGACALPSSPPLIDVENKTFSSFPREMAQDTGLFSPFPSFSTRPHDPRLCFLPYRVRISPLLFQQKQKHGVVLSPDLDHGFEVHVFLLLKTNKNFFFPSTDPVDRTFSFFLLFFDSRPCSLLLLLVRSYGCFSPPFFHPRKNTPRIYG